MSSLNGYVTGLEAKNGATWFIKPNHPLTSEMFFGTGKEEIHSSILGAGLTESCPMVNPANSTSSWANWNFAGLNTMPFLEQLVKNLHVCMKDA